MTRGPISRLGVDFIRYNWYSLARSKLAKTSSECCFERRITNFIHAYSLEGWVDCYKHFTGKSGSQSANSFSVFQLSAKWHKGISHSFPCFLNRKAPFVIPHWKAPFRLYSSVFSKKIFRSVNGGNKNF